MPRFFTTLAAAGLVCLGLASPARAYVDLAPTLGRIVGESKTISLVEVDQFRRDPGAVILKKVRDLKGETGADPIKHRVAAAGGAGVPRHILEWAEPGRRGVLFVAAGTTLVCLGQGWYQAHASSDGWWTLGVDRPDLPLAYQGTLSRLSDALELMLAGKTGVITTVPHGADDEAASFDLALNRTRLPGLARLQRTRASLGMPPVVAAVSASPAFLVGPGQAGEEEIPALLEKLKSPDATVRAESADDLRSLGPKARAAEAALAALLDDAAPRVRMSAAAALARIAPGSARPLSVLGEGLAHSDAAVRRHATRAVGLAGAAAAPLAGRLAALLGDADELTRVAALQSIATLGPAAAEACDAVTKLLDQPAMAIDAADALGRIGPAARPALKRLAEMLSSETAVVR
ncbi:MAG: HEAT repeat domain-containing protein, partial [Planctomycetes bacterium]|nr:HEAT repeat domain-containing protein [Planctomycetota bacterium]